MADGFAAVDYVTNLRLSEVGGKRLWLVRVPRHIQTTRLEGTKLTLPLRKNREGKVLGRVSPGDESDDDDGVAEREAFVLRAADAAESRGFRALFSTEEDDKLAPASSFAGQVNVSIESPMESRGLEEDSEDKVPTAALVEPYQGRPQLKGMRVRVKPAGAGSVYTRSRPPTGRDPSPPTTSRITVKKEVVADEAAASERFEAPPETPKTLKKKNKRKSADGKGKVKKEWTADGERKVKKEEWREGSASTTKKPKKKSRRKMSV